MFKKLWLIVSLCTVVALHGMEQEELLPSADSDIVMNDDGHDAMNIDCNRPVHVQLMAKRQHQYNDTKKCEWCSYLAVVCCPVSCLAAMVVGLGACPCMCCVGCYVKARCYEEGDSKLPCIECCATKVHDHCLAACNRGIWYIGCVCCNVACESMPCCCIERLCCCGATKRGYLAIQKVCGDELARRCVQKSTSADQVALLAVKQEAMA